MPPIQSIETPHTGSMRTILNESTRVRKAFVVILIRNVYPLVDMLSSRVYQSISQLAKRSNAFDTWRPKYESIFQKRGNPKQKTHEGCMYTNAANSATTNQFGVLPHHIGRRAFLMTEVLHHPMIYRMGEPRFCWPILIVFSRYILGYLGSLILGRWQRNRLRTGCAGPFIHRIHGWSFSYSPILGQSERFVREAQRR